MNKSSKIKYFHKTYVILLIFKISHEELCIGQGAKSSYLNLCGHHDHVNLSFFSTHRN